MAKLSVEPNPNRAVFHCEDTQIYHAPESSWCDNNGSRDFMAETLTIESVMQLRETLPIQWTWNDPAVAIQK